MYRFIRTQNTNPSKLHGYLLFLVIHINIHNTNSLINKTACKWISKITLYIVHGFVSTVCIGRIHIESTYITIY